MSSSCKNRSFQEQWLPGKLARGLALASAQPPPSHTRFLGKVDTGFPSMTFTPCQRAALCGALGT